VVFVGRASGWMGVWTRTSFGFVRLGKSQGVQNMNIDISGDMSSMLWSRWRADCFLSEDVLGGKIVCC
jgi:hypothetical protein